MAYGDRELSEGSKGPDVVELQMRLAGFRGTLPDGDFGAGTKLQVVRFQRDWMKMPSPTGRVDAATFSAIDEFAGRYPVDFNQLKCRCGICTGFGQGKFKGLYFQKQKVEAFYRYEYPGIHRMVLWAFRAAMFYVAPLSWRLAVNSGYRCSEDNRIHNRQTTNHHGKAIDIDILDAPSKMIDMKNCDQLRGLLVEESNAQIGWGARNRKALEPSSIAPTWVHYDVRTYDASYLADRYFVKTLEALNAVLA